MTSPSGESPADSQNRCPEIASLHKNFGRESAYHCINAPCAGLAANLVPVNQSLRFGDSLCRPPTRKRSGPVARARPASGSSNAHRLSSGLSLGLGAGDGALGLARDLAHDFLALFFGDVFHKNLVGLFQFGIGVDAIHDALAHPLLPVELADFIQDDGAFEPVTRHPLQVGPMFGVVLDVGINLGLHFGVGPVGGRVGRCGGGTVGGAIGRTFWLGCAHNEFSFFCWF